MFFKSFSLFLVVCIYPLFLKLWKYALVSKLLPQKLLETHLHEHITQSTSLETQASMSWTLCNPHPVLLLQIFMRNSAMQMHARELTRGSEVKPHQCQQCLKSFSSNHQLVQHIRVHTGEKPYKCSYCDRRFKQLSHVQQHTRLHTGKIDTSNFNFINLEFYFVFLF